MGLLRFIRCVLCCYEEEENRHVHRYQPIPDFVQRPNYERHLKYTAPAYIPSLSRPASIERPSNLTHLPQSSAPPPSKNVASTNQRSIRTSPVDSATKSPNLVNVISLPKPQTNFQTAVTLLASSSTSTSSSIGSPTPISTSTTTISKVKCSTKSPVSTSNKNVAPNKTSLIEGSTKSPQLVKMPKPQTNHHSPKSVVTLFAPSSEVNSSAKSSILSLNDSSSSDSQISVKNVASASKKKKKALTEPEGKSPQQEKALVHKPQVSLSSQNSKDPGQDPSSTPTPILLPPDFKPPPLFMMGTCSYGSSQNTPKKNNYALDPKAITPLYSVPEDFKELIKKEVVPQVLRKHLTPATYKNFFEALMYAEDYYCEKWSDYLLEDVKLELHEAAIYMRPGRGTNMTGNRKNTNMNDNRAKDKVFVAFQIDSTPERRPFLLSRDYVHLRLSGKGEEVEPFQGVLYRVVRGGLVLADFGDDFHLQHSSSRQYDVSFSFNRVCLKRSYQALSATTDTLLHNFLFPDRTPRVNMLDPPIFTPYLRNLDKNQLSAVKHILRLNSSPPFLVEGPLSIFFRKRNVMEKSATYFVIQEAVQQIYRSSPGSRILINAPKNIICDMLMRSLMVEIPESEIFRANAAFREQDEVDDSILSLCPIEGECFTCPPLEVLQEFKVVLSTYMSSFRLRNQGINTGHFSHIFLVDASSIMEPEMIVSLSNLANEKTVVVVTGAHGNSSGWVRSEIGREYGLKMSYFERLWERQPYCSLDPLFVACIRGNENENDRMGAFPDKNHW